MTSPCSAWCFLLLSNSPSLLAVAVVSAFIKSPAFSSLSVLKRPPLPAAWVEGGLLTGWLEGFASSRAMQ